MNLHVRIEHVVLEGLPLHAHDGDLVQAAIRTELQRLFTEQGMPADMQLGIGPDGVHAPRLRLDASPHAGDIGVQIGAGIYHAVAGPNHET